MAGKCTQESGEGRGREKDHSKIEIEFCRNFRTCQSKWEEWWKKSENREGRGGAEFFGSLLLFSRTVDVKGVSARSKTLLPYFQLSDSCFNSFKMNVQYEIIKSCMYITVECVVANSRSDTF